MASGVNDSSVSLPADKGIFLLHSGDDMSLSDGRPIDGDTKITSCRLDSGTRGEIRYDRPASRFEPVTDDEGKGPLFPHDVRAGKPHSTSICVGVRHREECCGFLYLFEKFDQCAGRRLRIGK